VEKGKKVYPKIIEAEVQKALSHYPELDHLEIHFRFKKIRRESFMLAQPYAESLLKRGRKRAYQIIINEEFFTKNPAYDDGKIPFNVIVGWLGHELGHIKDYTSRSGVNLFSFGLMYISFNNFIRKAEIAADKYCVEAGLGDELLESKTFSRNPQLFTKSYIRKLQNVYPSIQQVKVWVQMFKGQLPTQ
jgi:hypothetical protein